MAINSVWVCKYDERFIFEDLVASLKNDDYFEETTTMNVLKHKVDIKEECEENDLKFIFGKYGYEYEANARSPKITKERIIDTGDLIVKSKVIGFWIDNKHRIIFSLKDNKSKNYFANYFLGSESYISNVNIDLDKVHSAINDGNLSGMWAHSFEDRENNINKGTVYGTQVNEDPIFIETIEATKKFAGIIKDIGDEEIKMRLYHDGGIQIYGGVIEPDNPLLFAIIDDFDEFFE